MLEYPLEHALEQELRMTCRTQCFESNLAFRWTFRHRHFLRPDKKNGSVNTARHAFLGA